MEGFEHALGELRPVEERVAAAELRLEAVALDEAIPAGDANWESH